MSSVDVMREYLRERYGARRFVPLALILAGVGLLASPDLARETLASNSRTVLRGSVVAYLLVLVFRIWDDLEDRERDTQLHPGRVTGRIATVTPLILLLAVVATLATAVVLTGPQPIMRMMALALLTAIISVWYGARNALTSAPAANALVVLVKYPVLASVTAPAALWDHGDGRAIRILLALYLALCIHEALDDPVLRRSLGRGSST
ncbi:MAG: hypothetical protein ABJE10_22310 [bacterium]